MAEEHRSFLTWAAGYESKTGMSRNLEADRAFLASRCDHLMTITEAIPFQELVARVIEFLTETPNAEQANAGNRAKPSA